MKQILLIPVVHRNERRLLVKFDYDSELTGIIRKIEGSTFSNTQKSWHVANNPEKLKELFRVFNGFASLDTTAIFDKIPFLTEKKPIAKLKQSDFDEKDVVLMKDADERGKKLGAKIHNEAMSTGWQELEKEGEPLFNPMRKSGVVYIDIIDEKKIILKFPFAKAHIAKLKTLPFYFWDTNKKYWTFPYTLKIKSEIENYFAQFGFNIECRFIKAKSKDFKEKKNYSNDKKMPDEYMEMLTLKRYSLNTIDTYKTAFEGFINFYKTKEPADISYQEINDYLLHLVEKRKVSASF